MNAESRRARSQPFVTRRSALWWSAASIIANFVYLIQLYGGQPFGRLVTALSFAVAAVAFVVCWVCAVVLAVRHIAARGPGPWSMALMVVAVLLLPPLNSLFVAVFCRGADPAEPLSPEPPS